MKNSRTVTVLSKAAYIKELIARDKMAIVFGRTDYPGVVLPPHLHGKPFAVFGFDTAGSPPLYNFVIDENGIGADMTFNPSVVEKPEDVISRCYFPWSAVYAVLETRQRKGLMWHEDAPPAGVAHGVPLDIMEAPDNVELPIVMSA